MATVCCTDDTSDTASSTWRARLRRMMRLFWQLGAEGYDPDVDAPLGRGTVQARLHRVVCVIADRPGKPAEPDWHVETLTLLVRTITTSFARGLAHRQSSWNSDYDSTAAACNSTTAVLLCDLASVLTHVELPARASSRDALRRVLAAAAEGLVMSGLEKTELPS